jgi:hypothetical protein
MSCTGGVWFNDAVTAVCLGCDTRHRTRGSTGTVASRLGPLPREPEAKAALQAVIGRSLRQANAGPCRNASFERRAATSDEPTAAFLETSLSGLLLFTIERPQYDDAVNGVCPVASVPALARLACMTWVSGMLHDEVALGEHSSRRQVVVDCEMALAMP